MKIQCFHSSSAGNLYSVSDGETEIMIECGVEFKEIQKCFKFNISSLGGAITTHCHFDHAKSWRDVSKYIPVYMLKETADELGANGYNIKAISFLNTFHIGTFYVLPIPAVHDVPCCSYLIRSMVTDETLLFATDTAYMKYAISKVNYAMVECNYQQKYINESVESGGLDASFRKRIMSTHSELETTVRFLKGLDQKCLKEIYVLHLSKRHTDANEIKERIQRETGKPVFIAKA